LRGDLTSALHFNAAFLVLLPLAMLWWMSAAFPQRFAWLDPLRANSTRMVKVVSVLLVAFTVVRNLPIGESWLRYPGA
jgi:hypothetical protein